MNKKRQNRQPTDKQVKALELIRQGVPKTVAMRQAGYSDETSRTPSKNLLGLPSVQGILEQYKEAYIKVGITPDYLVKKTAEWLEAKKVVTSPTEPDREVPDYQTQLKAAEMVRRDFGLGVSDKPDVAVQINNYQDKVKSFFSDNDNKTEN